MYRHCLFCSRDLGRNEALEAFPVGRRLAYDAAKGRLWVVCSACGRWNLTPLEERWEAIEQAERLFRGTRLRASTDNVGLALVADATELIRVGAPLRPEFAAWRYRSDGARRRRLTQYVAAGALGGAAVAAAVGSVVMPIVAVSWGIAMTRRLATWAHHGVPMATVARVQNGTAVLRVRRKDLLMSHFLPAPEGEVRLSVAHAGGRAELVGDAALRAAATLLPATNWLSGGPEDVRRAVARLEQARDPAKFVQDFCRRGPRLTGAVTDRRTEWLRGQPDWMPPLGNDANEPERYDTGLLAVESSLRLAVEMALHEERERRALDGELADLECAWRDAEALAAIADNLALPDRVERAFERVARRSADAPAS